MSLEHKYSIILVVPLKHGDAQALTNVTHLCTDAGRNAKRLKDWQNKNAEGNSLVAVPAMAGVMA